MARTDEVRGVNSGRRNLAVVGKHRDYHADMLDGRTGHDPSTVTGCASAEDAATSYFRNVFENSGGLVRSAVVAVWPVSGEPLSRKVFELAARLTPCTAPDAEPGERDVAIEARERLGLAQ
jgi:hypothetical protein